MAKQLQQVGDDTVAIQSYRDIIVYNNGLTPEQMGEIFRQIAEQQRICAAMARQVADERMCDLEHKLIEKFAKLEEACAQAFADPDFQYLLGQVQHGYHETATWVRQIYWSI